MRITRRAFMGSAAAGLVARPGWADGFAELRAAPAAVQIAPQEYAPTPVWAYGGQVPGAAIRVRQGDRVQRRLVNGLDQPTTVHWHGLRIANAMDGVPGMTQDAVPPGGTFDYDFVAPDAGTYWYHPHNRTWEQLARGLAGPLIVEEAEAPEVDGEHVLVFDDWRLEPDATLSESFGNMHDLSHGGRIGNWVTVNGVGEWAGTAQRGDRLRLRLINAATARIFSLGLEGFDAWVVALDGQPLEVPQRVEQVGLGPAQRVDLIADVTGTDEAMIISYEADGGYAVAAFAVSGDGAARDAAPVALPPNPVPALGSLDNAPVAELRMEGGAMGRMRGAMLGGEQVPMRELVGAGKAWALNGMADMPEEPLIEAALGETVRVRMINDTAWPHAMHLHGHHFRQLRADGPGPLRDTILMQRGETVEVAFVADNPGDWLFHCHMVEHSAAGMMTWMRVV
ncbi:multicopper oxidase family protein [Aestuariibius sp. 2305UL40-4]|uniref:multicopper oxidase family protein n=1 Tax=Aestuariibius violaceus TaxID=3234132 RepID=UPI00345E7168